MSLSVASLIVLAYVAYDIYTTYSSWVRINSRTTTEPTRRQLLPMEVDFKHVVMFAPLRFAWLLRQFYAWFLTLTVWLIPKFRVPITEETVVATLLETSAMIYITHLEGTIATLTVNDFAAPICKGKKDCTLLVQFDAETKEVFRFEFNGQSIESPAEMLAITCFLISTVVHPVVHTFHNQLYSSRAAVKYPEIFMHGQSLNDCAHYFPGIYFGCGPQWFQDVLLHNGEKPVHPHSLSTLQKLQPYSRVARLLLNTRPIIFRLIKRHEVSVDPEAFFLCTAVHSLDHYMLGEIIHRRYMSHSVLPNKLYPLNCLALIFYPPVQTQWCNNLLRTHQSKTPFYKDLYNAFAQADSGLADQISLSLAY